MSVEKENSASNNIDIKKMNIFDVFRLETSDHLKKINDLLLLIEKDPYNTELFNQIFR